MSIDSKVEGVRAVSVAGMATLGITATDLVTYLTIAFIILQMIALTPKVGEAVRHWRERISGEDESDNGSAD